MSTPSPLTSADPRSGYTLPVFACASAIAALRSLLFPTEPTVSHVTVDLVQPPEQAEILVEQVGHLPDGSVLAITRSDPGDNLDLTRHTPIWATVQWGDPEQTEPVLILGGEGIGRIQTAGNKAAIYRYAQTLLQHNLQAALPAGKTLRVTISLPEGRTLAERTSNAAFGVVEGLSLLGTSGISHPLSAPDYLNELRHELRTQAAHAKTLVFCLGENGLALADQMGIKPELRVKTANWLGPMLVDAGELGVDSILLFGYHGKLIKLAGGIFHTHHFVADGRQEILAAYAAAQGVPPTSIQQLLTAATAEAGWQHLRQLTTDTNETWAERVYSVLAEQIDARAMQYIQTHCGRQVEVGSLLFSRDRTPIVTSYRGAELLSQVC